MRGDFYELTTSPEDVIVSGTSAAGGVLTITSPSPAANQYWLITGYDYSQDAAPSAAISGGIQQAGVTFLPIRLPATVCAPVVVNYKRGIAKGTPTPVLGATVGFTMAAIGGAAIQAGALRGVLVTVG